MKKQKKLPYKIITFLSSLVILLSQTLTLSVSNRREHWKSEKTTLKREWNQPEQIKKRTFRIRPLGNKIDLKKRYFPNRVWVKERGYNGLWIKNNGKKWGNREFNLTNAFLSRSRYFPLPFYETEFFSSYEELLSFLDSNIKRSWEYIVNNICWRYQDRLKELIVLFYNFIANIIPIDEINQILRRIDTKELPKIWGVTYWIGQYIELEQSTLYCTYVNQAAAEWTSGSKSTNSIFKTLFHELGHLIYFYYFYKNVDPIIHLKSFLTAKIDNLQNLDQEKVFQLFHLSNYSFEDNSELFAEGFAYLFLTNPLLKTKAWEFWYEFHTWYLPKVLWEKNNNRYLEFLKILNNNKEGILNEKTKKII